MINENGIKNLWRLFGGGEISSIEDKFIGIKYKEDEIKKSIRWYR